MHTNGEIQCSYIIWSKPLKILKFIRKTTTLAQKVLWLSGSNSAFECRKKWNICDPGEHMLLRHDTSVKRRFNPQIKMASLAKNGVV